MPLLLSPDSYPLSALQKGMVFHTLKHPDSGVYIQQLIGNIYEELDVSAFTWAFTQILQRYPNLRVHIHFGVNGEPVQVLEKTVRPTIRQKNLGRFTEKRQAEKFEEFLKTDRQQGFDLQRPPLMRVTLFRFSDSHYKLVWTSHHLLFDGRSRVILLKELCSLYQAKRKGIDLELPAPTPYWAFINWLESQDFVEHEDLWKETLAGIEAPTPLMIDLPQTVPHLQEEVSTHTLSCSETLTTQLGHLSHKTETTLNTLVMSTWALILSRYSGQSDVVFGVTRTGRSCPVEGIQDMVGLCINTLPMRVTIPQGMPTADWVKKVRAQWVALNSVEQTPLASIQGWSEITQGEPLFESLVVFEHCTLDSTLRSQQKNWPNWTFHLEGMTNYPLVISGHGETHLRIDFTYNRHRFDPEAIERLAGHFNEVLETLVARPQQALDGIPLLSPHEHQEIVVDWNTTQSVYPKDRCIHELFEKQVLRTPEAVATEYNGRHLSYRELNRLANDLAQHLRAIGVKPETPVGILMERSTDLVVSLLAILKAGGTYIPLDPAYPEDRIRFMLEDSQAAALVIHTLTRQMVSCDSISVVDIDNYGSCHPDGVDLSSDLSQTIVQATNLAYILYTSGSTGRPKGVAIEHKNVVNFLYWFKHQFTAQEYEAVLASTSICFDLSVFEIFGPLSWGGTVVIVKNVLHLQGLPAADRVTLVNTVPSAISALLQAAAIPSSVEVINLAGEPLTPMLVTALYEQTQVHKVYDLYGPSEATTYSTGALRQPHAPGTIGRPLLNTQTYVLDSHRHPVPVQIPGELFIGGDGLARGYWQQPVLTAEKFTPDHLGQHRGGRVYRTGDLVRQRMNGELEFLGRIDHQVKIRGHRIELGEIQEVLTKHEQVKESVVIVRSDLSVDQELVAYVVSTQEHGHTHTHNVRRKELQAFLGDKLPSFMIPSIFVFLDALPLTPNGKIDRKALPAPSVQHTPETHHYIAPRTRTEFLLAEMWAQVLRVKQVGMTDNFFSLGGHSLLAMKVVVRVRTALNVELPLQILFDTPTIAAVAEVISHLNPEVEDETVPILGSLTRPEPIPLSYAQERLWFLDRWEPNSPLYNMAVAYRLHGSLQIGMWEQAFQTLVKRHETLRTTFVEREGVPTQIIHPEISIPLTRIDLSQEDLEQRAQQATDIAFGESRRPFDLVVGPLVRCTLISLEENNHLFLLTLHHIISDGWSLELLFREFLLCYQAAFTKHPSNLSPLPMQYADFALWQREWLQGKRHNELLVYWRNQLTGAPPILPVPGDFPRPPVPSYHGRRQPVAFSAELAHALHELSEGEGVTLFMVMLAAFQVLLARYTGQFDVVVGTPIANRSQEELEGVHGFFANTLVLRTDVSGHPTFQEVVRRVRNVCLGAYAHQDVPFEQLVEELQPERDLSRNPLFQVMFQLYTPHDPGVTIPNLTVSRQILDSGTAKFDLLFSLGDRGNGLYGGIEYATDLFEESTITRLIGHYQRLLEEIIADPARPIDQLPFLPAAEETQVLVEWNATTVSFPQDSCVHELVEEQARHTPDSIAVVFGEQAMTYSQLNHQANALARHLQDLGVGPDILVGVCVERSVDMVVTVLAVLKAGGTYVPLDPTYPQSRLSFILKNSEVAVLVTQRQFHDLFAESMAHHVWVDEDLPLVRDAGKHSVSIPVTPTNLAYVMYTSGSTGQPKGVAMPHHALVNLVTWQAQQTTVPRDARTLQFTSLNFDVSAQEIFTTLGTGGTLILVNETLRQEPVDLMKFLMTAQVERLFVPVVALHQLAEVAEAWELFPTGIQEIITAGEALQITPVLRRFLARLPQCTLNNHYGPTETHVCTALTLDGPSKDWPARPPIGRPIANEEAYVLDKFLQPVPIGVDGELYVGGIGLARGYVNRTDLTAERFLPNPFGLTGGARVYKTGDVVCYRSTGIIEFIGRKDHQIKLRGYRIEVGEIEVGLEQHDYVSKAVVVLHEDEGQQQLVAYVVPTPTTTTLDAAELHRFLTGRMPAYMVPSSWIILDAFPLTPTGKIDRRALLAPTRSTLPFNQFVPPETHEEEQLAEIWKEVLKVEQVGRHENFFSLGGHSLLAMILISRVRKVFGIELSIRTLFEAPTIAELSEQLGKRISKELGRILPTSSRGARPLSFAQQRLWFLEQWEPNSALYNVPSVFRLRGPLHVDALQRALLALVERHDGLRTIFQVVDDQPCQHIQTLEELASPGLTIIEVSNKAGETRDATLQRMIAEETHRPFDLTRGPLFRAQLLPVALAEAILILTLHHIITDGWSMEIFLKELAMLYAAEVTGTPANLPALPIQYADYAIWQRNWLQGDVLAKQLTYWRQQLDGAPPVLELPTDYPRPVVPSHRGAKHRFTFSADLTQHLRTLSHQHGVSLFMTLLAAFQVFLARYTGQPDIVVGSPMANRTHEESEGLIGFLVNTLLFRTRLDGNPTFAEVLGRVKDVCLDAYAHQDLPFEKLVEELQPERDPSRNPLFQVMLQLQKNDVQVLTLPGLEIERLPNPGGLAKFDLNLFFLEDGKDLQGIVDYSTDLFAASTITRMLDHFQTLVQALVANPEQLVYSIEFLTEAERQQQLVDWNATTTTYPAESCVHHLFEAQVAERPNAIAVVYENEQLTYQAFNLKANRLAQQLQQQGVLRGDIVPVVMERSVELIISYFAIMKVGAAFSPLDPNWPSDRLRTLLTQLSSHVVLTNQDPGALKTLCPEKRVMAVDASTLAAHPENLHVSVQPEDPIYVLFTSGSTGIPKGAINHHRGIVNRLWNMQQRYSWSEDDVVLVTLRHTFDASLWQYLWPLTHGARLVLPSPSPWLDMFLIVQLMEQERVTLSGFVPSLFALFVDEVEQQPLLRDRLRSLRQLLIGGEALHAPSVNQFRRGCPGVQISNSYGPTEASISTIYHEVPDPCKDPIPIGRPLKNVKAVILDDQLNLVPVGVPGELHLGGVCVGLGYLNNPKATQAAFIPNPFPELNTSILYKTGDRACFQPDGTIRYLGRRDHQVKINGVRMELGEIEVVLRRHPEVKQAVVQPWATPSGGNRLVAYVVGTQTNASLEYSEITNFLSQYLPTYMIPSTFRILEQLPLLPNGKINRHALPPPQSSRSQSEEFIPPQTPHEERLARIFAEVLKVEVVGRHDNFFALGGHSLLAMMMVSRIHKIFGITLEVRALFDQPTIANLASYLEAQTVKPTEPDVAPRPREDGALPLSFAQQRLWFLDQWEPDSPLYNIPKVFRLSGPLNIQALHQALALLVTRHETLRTTFTSVDGTPYHVISEDTGPNVIFHDLKEWSLTSPQDRALELAIQEAEQPFQLHRGPLFRVMLLELSDQEHWLCLTLHHIIADGWSLEILWRELGVLYTDCLNGRTPDLSPLALQYGDFAIWEREWSQGDDSKKQRAYWRHQLQNVPTVLDLPTDFPRPMRQSYKGDHERFTIPELLTSKLRALSQREGLTMFMLLIGAFQVLLYRYSGQRDMVVGTPVARRPLDEVEGLIGLFINTLLIRTRLDGNPTFRDVFTGLKETCLDAYANRDLPFENLIEELQSNRDPSRNPLFQVLFHLYTPLDNLQRFPGLVVSEEAVYRGTAKVDLAMTLTDTGSSIQGSVEYATDLFEPKTIHRFIEHFTVLVEEIAANPDQKIDTLPLLSRAEQNQLLMTWNNTSTDYPRDICLHDLVQQQALRTPDAIVLVYEDQQFTYREVTRRASQLANYLVSLGVGPEVRVGLCHERSAELIIGLLGILQAGGAYVPLDPTYPLDRLRYMTHDAQIPIVVTQEHLESLFPQESLIKVSLDRDWPLIATYSAMKPPRPASSTSLAYVIYTSGSTGRPKGVQIEHRNVVNFLIDVEAKLKNAEPGITLTTTSFSFDISILEVFGPLAFGGRIILASQAQVRDGHQLVETLALESVTKMLATPAGWRLLLETNWKGQPDLVILTGGEALSEDLANELLPRGAALWNLYGPTETTIFSTCTRIVPSDKRPITIGSPIANTQTYIVNTECQPVPIGVPGELYIGGDGLSRGYLNRPDLTAERFLPDPFSQHRGGRLYRTGDRTKYRANGKIEWLGRLDHQVKLRGFRIELGEIEKALMQWPNLAQVVVIIRTDAPGMARLVAYYRVTPSQAPPSVEKLKCLVRQQLPEYMVPNGFVQLDEFPLTPNGKVDRNALPISIIRHGAPKHFEPPQNITEKGLAEIWSEILGIKDVGSHDNFFELGGNSLLAMQVISRVRKAFSLEIFVRTLFEAPTVAGLAEFLAKQNASSAVILRSYASNTPHPLSFAQQRLWFLDQWEPDSALYNLPYFFRLRGPLKVDAFRNSLRALVERHASLRTIFQGVDDMPCQHIQRLEELTSPYLSLIEITEEASETRDATLQRMIAEETHRPFDLTRGPLFRAQLLSVAESETVFILTLHHIITDGWSMEILLKELSVLYAAESTGTPATLPALPMQYADYAVWQRDWLQGDVLAKQLTYWRQQLDGAPPVLELPTDYPRPVVPSHRGAKHRFTFSADLTQHVHTLSHQYGVSLFMTLLAAFQVFLAHYTGQTDIVVGSPIANRTHQESEGLIGFLVNTLLFRTRLDGNPTFAEVLVRVKDMCLDAYDHQDLPFEKLVEELQPERDPSRNPLFQVMLQLQKNDVQVLTLPGLEIERLPNPGGLAKFDLNLFFVEDGQDLQGIVDYSTDLFAASTITRMLDHFQTLVKALIANPEQPVFAVQLLTEAERHQQLVEWNDTTTTYPSESCVHHLFEAQVAERPNAIAVVYENEQLTYAQLNQRANQLAHYLQREGVGLEARIGVCLERSVDLIVSLLAILKAGGAYVPLDPSYPQERLAYMMEDAGLRCLVTTAALQTRLPLGNCRIIAVDSEQTRIPQETERNLQTRVSPENLAYVIYTSGSTGQPKGVGVSHQNVIRLFQATHEVIHPTAQDVWTLFHSYAFDFSVWELWGALHSGGQLVVIPSTIIREPDAFHQLLNAHQVTILNQTPSAFRQLSEHMQALGHSKPPALRLIIFGGEAVEVASLRLWMSQYGDIQPRLLNMYGITETTVHVTHHQVTSEEVADTRGGLIGTPLPDLQVYLLDAHDQLVPQGVSGELHIGGGGLARGYLNRPALTAARFRPNPFTTKVGQRLYQSGDVGRYGEAGQLHYLGRNDGQVKLRGFRIELGEIEAALRHQPNIKETLVLCQADPSGDKRLVAYVVPTPNASLDLTTLRTMLKTLLPEYMVPTAFMLLDVLPLTPNGKVDRKALPTPKTTDRSQEMTYVAPRTPTEKTLVEIWQSVLNVSQVGIQDNFFELGGHSLLAMQMISRVRKAFSIEIFVRTLFEAPTLSAFATVLAQLNETQVNKISYDERQVLLPKKHFPSGPLVLMSNDSMQEATGNRFGQPDFSNADTPLICLQPQGTMPPLFCVHPIGGGITCYQELVQHLGKEHPVYALQAIVFIPTLGHDPSLEELASFYIQHIQGLDPLGPFHLCGWSMGGVIAYEMARQLKKMGQHVQMLTLIDSFLPIENRRPAITAHDDLLKQFFKNLSHGESLTMAQLSLEAPFLSSSPDETLSAILDIGLQQKILPVGMERSHMKQLWQIFLSLHHAFARYVPKPYSGRLQLLQASEHSSAIKQQAQEDWKSVATGGVEVFPIQGNHYSIFQLPHIQTLASRLRTCLGDVAGKDRDAHSESTPHESGTHVNDLSPSSGGSHGEPPHISNLLKDLPQEFRVEHHQLSSLIEEGNIPPIDSVALYYLPDQYLHESGLTRDAVIHGWYHNQPTLTHILDTSIGRIGSLMLPLTGIELYSEQKELLELSQRGLEIASQAGATTASLTGLLPSATDYGHAIQQAIDKRGDLPRITTGHGTTAATVVLAIRKILEVSQRDMRSECVGFLGLGSIGLASLRLMLSCLPHPQELLLCDVYHRKDALEAIRQEVLTTHGFQGNIRLVESTGVVPKAFYESRLIIGATNVPDVLDVERLQPGTLIVDDSGPHCFRVAKAIERSMNQQDILFTEGGILQSPTVIPCLRYLPRNAMQQITPGLARLFSRFHPWRITGCVLASILLAKVADQKQVFGLVDVQTGVDNFNILLKLGYEAAELNCEGYTLPPSLIEKVATLQ